MCPHNWRCPGVIWCHPKSRHGHISILPLLWLIRRDTVLWVFTNWARRPVKQFVRITVVDECCEQYQGVPPTNTFCHLKEDIILIQAHVHSTAPEMDYFPWCMALKVIILRSTQRLFSLPIRICGTNWMNPHLIIDLKRRRWPWGAIGRVGGKRGGGLTHGDTWPLIWAAQSERSADSPEARFFGEWNIITR